jgi:hypothetical protein
VTFNERNYLPPNARLSLYVHPWSARDRTYLRLPDDVFFMDVRLDSYARAVYDHARALIAAGAVDRDELCVSVTWHNGWGPFEWTTMDFDDFERRIEHGQRVEEVAPDTGG